MTIAYYYVDKFNSDILNLIVGVLEVLVNTVYFLITPLIWLGLTILSMVEWMLHGLFWTADFLLEQLYKIPRLLRIAQMGFEEGIGGVLLHLENQINLSELIQLGLDIFLIVLYVFLIILLAYELMMLYRVINLTFPNLKDYEQDLVTCILGSVFLIIFFFITVEWFSL